MLELEGDLSENERAQGIVNNVKKLFGQTSTKYESLAVSSDSIAHLIQDVMTTQIMEINTDSESTLPSDVPEEIWKAVSYDRAQTQRLHLLKFFLSNSEAKDKHDAETIITSLQKIDAILNDSPLQHRFYSDNADLENVNREIRRLVDLRKLAISYMNYGPTAEPKKYLKKSKKKEIKKYPEVIKALRSIYESHVKLFSLLSPTKERPPISKILNSYLLLHEQESKQSLAGRKIVSVLRDITVPGRGNIERVEVVGMSVGANNIIPLRVVSRKYKVVNGAFALLRDEGGRLVLGEDELPIIYSDNYVVAADDEHNSNPCVFQSLQ